ncbi:MAG: MFS transporter [Planctomycetes bacterium]|nr:MFS transporter [Planctomycetota bacterium]
MEDEDRTEDRPADNEDEAGDADAPLPAAELRRALILSTLGSTIGAFFFPLAGGNIFNRYVEYIGLKEEIGAFMAMMPLAMIVTVFSSWIIQLTGLRRLFFFAFAGIPRLMWLGIVTIPLWGPPDDAGRLKILLALVFVYWVCNSMSNAAWFSWMRDIVPGNYRGRLFSYRNTLIQLVGATWGLGAGYYLEKLGLNLDAFRTIYTIGVTAGVLDIATYIFVPHPPMKVKQGEDRGFMAMVRAAAHGNFIKFTAVHALWWFSCSMVAVSAYFLMRGIGMEIYSIQLANVFFGTCIMLVFNLLWGRFLDQYGFKSTFSIALLIHVVSPVFYALTAYFGHSQVWLYLGLCFGTMAIAGTNLANTALVFAISSREDQTMTLAARSFISGVIMFTAYMTTQKLLFPAFKWIGTRYGFSELWYLVVIFGIAAGIRVVVYALWMRLPDLEGGIPTGVMVRVFYTTNPLKAFYSLGRFIVAKSGDMVGKKKYSELHPSARWHTPEIPDSDCERQ